nr:hypothetical protein 9 [bacterium]
MALGTNYKRINDRDDKRIANNLQKHFELMQKYIEQGMDEAAASKKAYKELFTKK